MQKTFFILPFLGLLVACGGAKKEETPTVKKDSIISKSYNVETDKAVGIGRIEPEGKFMKIYPEAAGNIQSLNMKTGQDVKKGDVLLVLDNSVEDNKIAKVKAQMESQDVQIQSQSAQVRAQEIQVKSQETQIQSQQTQINGFEKDIAKARIAEKYAQKNFDRIAKTFNEGAETKQNYENAENQLQIAQAEVERLIAQQNNLKAAQDNLRAAQDNLKAQIDIQKAQQNNLKAKIGELKADLGISQAEKDKRVLYAPQDGKILSVNVTNGAYITPATSLADFAPQSPVNVVCEIDELFAAKVNIGQKAKVYLQGSKEVLAEGEVIEVAPYLKQKSLFSDEVGKLEDRRVREVRVRLSNPPANLLYGARVDCEVLFK